jgi:hypothetical protein
MFPSIGIVYQEINEQQSRINTSGKPELTKLAILGMSGRFPDAEDPEKF